MNKKIVSILIVVILGIVAFLLYRNYNDALNKGKIENQKSFIQSGERQNVIKDEKGNIIHKYGFNNGGNFVEYDNKLFFRILNEDDFTKEKIKDNFLKTDLESSKRKLVYYDLTKKEDNLEELCYDFGNGPLYIVDDIIFSTKDREYYSIDIKTKEINEQPTFSLINQFIKKESLPAYTFNYDADDTINIYSTYNDKSSFTIEKFKEKELSKYKDENKVEYLGGNGVIEFFKQYIILDKKGNEVTKLYAIDVENQEIKIVFDTDYVSIQTEYREGKLYYKKENSEGIIKEGYIDANNLEEHEEKWKSSPEVVTYPYLTKSNDSYVILDDKGKKYTVFGKEEDNNDIKEYNFEEIKKLITEKKYDEKLSELDFEFNEIKSNVTEVEKFEGKMIIARDIVANGTIDKQDFDYLIIRKYYCYDLEKSKLLHLYDVDLRPDELKSNIELKEKEEK